ncbi:hypothetical protein R5R35_002872 [Gryllus longicercus]|uniref:Uncharacterized protein n=1 Tax=Gryllus longicercus TaxID=2509291 RepID=A0AAN9VNF1_9ORTH
MSPAAAYYDGRRGTHSNGQNYENKMGALLYLRAVNLTQGQVEAAAARAEAGAGPGAAGPALRLGLNVAWAGKFDDVVLLLAGSSAPSGGGGEEDDEDDDVDDDVDDGSRQLLMQLKHRERRPLTRALLAGNSTDFGLRKYFESYCKVASAPQVRARALRCVLYTNASVEVHGAPRDADFERLFVQLLNTGGSAGRLAQLDPAKDAAVCASFAGEARADDFRRQFFVCSQQAREDELDELLQQFQKHTKKHHSKAPPW